MANELAAEKTRIVADLPGAAIAVVEPGQVVVLDSRTIEPTAELGIPGDVDDHDVAFVGETGRLVVLSRSAGTSTLHIVDPTGPTKLGEVVLRVAARIASTSGEYVLITTGSVTYAIDVTAATPSASPLPIRGDVSAAGRMGGHRFVLAVSGVFEEWDALTRSPHRRLRLDRPLDPLFVGGNLHRVWSVSKQEPQFIDLVMLATRSTRRIELPEPIAKVDAHANGYTLAVIGAQTRSIYIVDMTRASAIPRLERGAMTDIAWLGEGNTLVLKPVGEPIELLTVAVSPELGEDAAPPAQPPVRGRRPAVPEMPEPDAQPRVVEDELPPARWTREDISERLAAWRNRYATPEAKAAAKELLRDPVREVPAEIARPQVVRATHDPRRAHPGGWRAELATWARLVQAGSHRAAPPTDRGVVDQIAQRLGLSDLIRDALALIYGARLAGSAPVSALDLAGVLDWSWTEALGSGVLAESGLVRWRDGTLDLHREVVAVLDERPPLHGAIVPATASTDSTVAIVVPAAIDPAAIGAWAAPTIGALLVANERGQRHPRAFVREARVRGVMPLVRWTDLAAVLRVPPPMGAVIVDTATTAASLDLPVVATWP
jgi:hypothetical protein